MSYSSTEDKLGAENDDQVSSLASYTVLKHLSRASPTAVIWINHSSETAEKACSSKAGLMSSQENKLVNEGEVKQGLAVWKAKHVYAHQAANKEERPGQEFKCASHANEKVVHGWRVPCEGAYLRCCHRCVVQVRDHNQYRCLCGGEQRW